MSRISILGTGLNGLIGSKLVLDYKNSYLFKNLDINHPQKPVDITNIIQVRNTTSTSNAKYLVHLAAFTDVNKAWKQSGDKSGLAYKVNVLGTKNIVEACEADNIHLIHISTAFVFDGTKKEFYTEQDKPKSIEWYGQTKLEAERVVQDANCPWTILRIDFPFRSDECNRPDIVKKTVKIMKKSYPLFNDHYFGPTYIDDLTKVIDWVIRTKTTGLFHASSGEKWSDYEFGNLINHIHNLKLPIKTGSITEYLRKMSRPYQKNTAMDSSLLQSKIDFKFKTIESAISEIHYQLI